MKTGFSLCGKLHRENPVLALYWLCTGPVLALYGIAVFPPKKMAAVYSEFIGASLLTGLRVGVLGVAHLIGTYTVVLLLVDHS